MRGRVHLEKSITETGFHGIGRGTLHPGRRQFDDPTRTHTGYAFYDKNRLFTFSGNILPGSAEICDVTPELADLHRELFPVATTNHVAATHRTVKASSAAALSDAELLERARRAKNGTKFSMLFDGDHTGYPSQSEADMALLRMLAFWTGRDATRMAALFRQSGLYREKSERADYIDGTIAKAIAETIEVFSPASAEKPVMAADDPVEPSTALPEIPVAGRELRDLSAQVLAALTAANQPTPKLFSRAGAVVRVDLTKDGGPMIINVTDVHLRGEMTRAANCFKTHKTKDGIVRTSISPPLDAAKDLLSRPPQELDFPGLEYISESPFLRPDGTVVCQPGYDPITRTFYTPSGPLDAFNVPERPTTDDIDAARGLIKEVFIDFPFRDAASLANMLALFLTPEVRPAIQGNVPAALLDAPQAGSGKSLLAEVVALKSTGASACMKPAPVRDEEEWRKTLTATIQAGHPLVIFDNVDAVLQSSNLAIALTARTWTDRILGQTAQVTLPVRTIFAVTGNNLVLGGDLPRRCYWIRVDAKKSEPWRGRTFKHPKLIGWVLDNRGHLLGAILTMARAWFVAGQPAAATPVLGSFEEWCRVIGGILHFAGVEGFLGNLDELYKQSDPSTAAWEAFLSGLLEQMPKTGFKVADVIDHLRSDGNSLRVCLPEDLGDMEPVERFKIRLGKAFRAKVDHCYGSRGVHLIRLNDNDGVGVWGVRHA